MLCVFCCCVGVCIVPAVFALVCVGLHVCVVCDRLCNVAWFVLLRVGLCVVAC